VPEEYRWLVINWLRFNRRNSQPRNFLERDGLVSDIGYYRLSNILNLDETPIPFEYLDGKTYDIKGSRTIGGKTDGSGWDKRQATLVLYIFVDGISRIKPQIIFHAKTGHSIIRREGHKWRGDVTVEFNETAYNNEGLFTRFIHEELLPALNIPYPITQSHQPHSPIPINNNPTHLSSTRSLLLMDLAAFHITDSILATLRENNIVPSIIPGGCTGLLQPLDTAVNKPFKEYLRVETDTYQDERAPTEDIGKWTVSEKRIMTTHVVSRAWKAFCQQKQSLTIVKAFQDVGVTLPIDGSKDDELGIKGFTASEIDIGNWAEDLTIPPSSRASQSYRTLPAETPEHDSLHYIWQCEDYQDEGDLDADAFLLPPTGGQLIDFAD